MTDEYTIEVGRFYPPSFEAPESSVDPSGSAVIEKEIIARAWSLVKDDWNAWNARSLVDVPIERLMLGRVGVSIQLDSQPVSISLLVAMGVRGDGEAVLLTVKSSMSTEITENWRAFLDDLIKRGLRRPQCLILDGEPELERAVTNVWDQMPVQVCTTRMHRKLRALAPERQRNQITCDYTFLIYASDMRDIPARYKAFVAKWRRRHRAVANCLEDAGDKLFTFTRLPLPPMTRDLGNIHTTYPIEHLHNQFKQTINTQTALPSADTAAMLFALPGQLGELIKMTQGAGNYRGADWPNHLKLFWHCFNDARGEGEHTVIQ